MRQHLNTLFVTREGAYLHQDGAAVDIRLDGKSLLRVPLHNLDGIITFGWDTTASAALMAACAEAGVTLSFCNPYGKFLATSNGFTSGNILLRRAQYRFADDPDLSLAIARNLIAAKITNTRHLVQRRQRDLPASHNGHPILENASRLLSHRIRAIQNATAMDTARGIEGEAAQIWFSALPAAFNDPANGLLFRTRTRRPPLDPVNALLSFAYNLLAHDFRSATEAAGLDAQCGFLHRDRPGRASLALDLMEAFRPALADRFVLTLFNRQQISPKDFLTAENGATTLKDNARKSVLTAWQERKQETLRHPFIDENVTIGLLPHLQARLLARHLRGDLDAYPDFIWK